MLIRCIIYSAFVTLAGCRQFEPAAPAQDHLLDGPVEALSAEERQRFLRGDIAFNEEVFHAGNGLGPLFVATRCGSCHAGDGPGHPFTTLVRFGQSDPGINSQLHMGGPQLQHRALPGVIPEELPPGLVSARFLPPINTGLGFLEAVPDAEILAWADPSDSDGDGISGRPNLVYRKEYSPLRDGTFEVAGQVLGRFGRKGSVYDLLQQTATAYNQDIGVVSVFEPVDPHTLELQDPEISTNTVQDVVFYLRTLKAPIQRDRDNPAVIEGEALFERIGCGRCHRAELTTGSSSIAALAHRTIRPYTDLLLHDMGPGLNDGYTEGGATSAEWRTPPLWGLGLFPASQGGSYFLLHDGRAHSVYEAIDLHGGEGRASRDAFRALSQSESDQLLRFLQSL